MSGHLVYFEADFPEDELMTVFGCGAGEDDEAFVEIEKPTAAFLNAVGCECENERCTATLSQLEAASNRLAATAHQSELFRFVEGCLAYLLLELPTDMIAPVRRLNA